MDIFLAEETGIHLGDGNLHVTIYPDNTRSHYYTISGNLLDELDYHQNYITSLIKRLYSLQPSYYRSEKKNSISTICKSKVILEYKNKILGLPIGKKKYAQIPRKIIGNSEFEKKFLVGIFDTDFSLRKYRLNGSLASLRLIKQISDILKQNHIFHHFRLFETYGRIIIPKDGTIKIVEEWGLHNNKHLSKYQLYKGYNKYFPFSHTFEREAVLSGKLSLEELSTLCEKRRRLGDQKRFPSAF